jgi:transposase
VAKAWAEAEKRKMRLRVMFQDEARFGRITSPRACWAPKGMRPKAPSQMVREYVHVFGAVSPADGRHDSLALPYADTEAMTIFLREVARRHRRDYMLMFMDQAGWHKSKGLKIPPNIELAYLPPHSPEPDPQEQVWDELREKHFGNRLFKSMDALVDALVRALRCMEASPAVLKSLTQRGWMKNEHGVL